MIVVDASAVLEVLLRTTAAEDVERRLFSGTDSWHAPHLIDLEVAQVVRRYTLAGQIDPERGREALADLGDLPITRYSHTHFLPQIWELRHNVTAYDAAYVALAEVLRAPLFTRDARLAGSSGHQASIELV